MDVKYKTTIVGKVNEHNIGTIQPEANSTFSIAFDYQIKKTDIPQAVLTEIATAIQTTGQITLDFEGPISIKYLFIPFSYPLKFSQVIKPT